MDLIQTMQIFVRVAELASFTRAADTLALPKASVSAAISQLEASLGSRLLHRTTRRVSLTQDGQAFYERCKDMLADIDELHSMFQTSSAQLTGRVRIDMSSGIAQNIVLPQLPQFLQQHPQLQVELSSTDRRVDLVREGFDLVLRVGSLQDSNLIARPLGRFPMRNCASPAYLAQYGTPTSVEQISTHQLVHYVPLLGSREDGFEVADQPDSPHASTSRSIAMAGRVTVNNSDAYLAACLAGLGIIQAPLPGVQSLLASGQLVEILPQAQAAPMPVTMLYANRRHLPGRVQVMMNWLAQVLRGHVV